MKLKSPLTTLALLGLLSSSALAADQASPNPSQFSSEKDKVSYSIGLDIGRNFTKQGIDFDTQAFIAGLEDGRQNKISRMTEQEVRDTLTALQTKLIQQQQEAMKKLADVNLKEGDAFLEKINPPLASKRSAAGCNIVF